jgi:hypothetical protein
VDGYISLDPCFSLVSAEGPQHVISLCHIQCTDVHAVHVIPEREADWPGWGWGGRESGEVQLGYLSGFESSCFSVHVVAVGCASGVIKVWPRGETGGRSLPAGPREITGRGFEYHATEIDLECALIKHSIS